MTVTLSVHIAKMTIVLNHGIQSHILEETIEIEESLKKKDSKY